MAGWRTIRSSAHCSAEEHVSNETNALLALKNAWTGAIAATDRLRELAPTVAALPEATDVATLDLEAYHKAALAQALASQALRGLLEDLRKHPPQD
jgi:hypothetical protein